MTFPDVSLAALNEHVRDLRTVLCGFAYALGRQGALNAEQLRTDLLEICLPVPGSPHMLATELATLLAGAIVRGRADNAADRSDT